MGKEGRERGGGRGVTHVVLKDREASGWQELAMSANKSQLRFGRLS